MNKTRSDNIEDFSSTLTYIELVVVGVIMTAISLVTLIGNALVVISFILDKKLRTLNNYFLLSLAASDIMIATFSMPVFTAYLLIGEWTLGPAICDMWLSQDYTCSNASCFNLLMIAIDRYFSVSNPLRYRAKRTAKRVGIMIACVWIISFLAWPPWIYGWPYIEGRRTVPEDDCYIQFLETSTFITIITVVFNYYIPVLILLVLYYRIWRETRRRSRYLANMETGYQSESMCLQPLNSSSSEKNKKQQSTQPAHTSNPNIDQKPDREAEKDTGTALLTDIADDGLETIRITETDNKNSDMDTPDYVQPKKSQKVSAKPDKAARVLTVILLAFVLTTMPYNIIVIIANLDTTHSIVPHSVWNFFYYLCYINSTLNPLCYALANENFRRTYWRILTCSWNKKPQGTYNINSYSNKSSESKL